MIYILSIWALTVFSTGADSGFLIIHPLAKSDARSGDGPPCICDVQSIKDHPSSSSWDIHHAGRHTDYQLWHLQRSKVWHRYAPTRVDPSFTKLCLTVSIVQLLDATVCIGVMNTPSWDIASTIIQFILSTAMCALVMTQFMRESLQMYKATRKLQFNKYMSLLVRDGLLYFFVYVPPFPSTFCRYDGLTRRHAMISTLLHSLLSMLGNLGKIPAGWVGDVLVVAATVPVYTLTPRFVMNIRELYMLDLQRRCGGDIDTGFGLSSGAGRGVGGTTTIRTIGFAEGSGSDWLHNEEAIATAREKTENSVRQASAA